MIPRPSVLGSSPGHATSTNREEHHLTLVRHPKNNDLANLIVSFENGELDEEEELDLLQKLIDTGLAWKLQGFYGRTCAALIQEGILHA